MDSLAPGGLSEAEARDRLRKVGPNELPRERRRTVVRIAAETLHEPMFLLLLLAAGLYLLLGDLGEGLFLLVGACAAVVLVVLQESRSERALAALRDLAQPKVRVIRDGRERLAEARELVPGDLFLIGEGERLHADALLVSGDLLRVDEAALSGESAPVTKRHAASREDFAADAQPGAEFGPLLFAGTLVVQGQGVARVSRTGGATSIGRLGAALAQTHEEPTPLQRTARRLVGLLGALAIGFCAVIAAAYGLLRGDWVAGVLAGITTAIALVPEEFPMVLAVFMALGAWRLAMHRVLVRRSAVIETLGGATMLCVDKTGTLTENRMEVVRLWRNGADVGAGADLPGEFEDLLRTARLASAVQPVDPMDRAVDRLAARNGGDLPAEGLLRTWPLEIGRLAVVQLWREMEGAAHAAAKGAPEAILQLCRLPWEQRDELMERVGSYAEQGLRVLAVARAPAPPDFEGAPENLPFEFVGLLGFLDPLRPEAATALAEARQAGIGVMMITGDHPATARAVAAACGLDLAGGVLTGAEVASLAFPTLCERLRSARVIARVSPDQKLLIVEALRANGEVVAMTGDGVNDAPALEAAHIGIAMGRRGTDVAREASDLVLLDDSFASVVGGVRLGRRIFANLRRALTYVTAIHVPIAGLALAPVLVGLPPLLAPMHVVLLELAIDPTCALAFENEPSDRAAMKRPPRPMNEPLFGLKNLTAALGQGLVVFAGVFALYVLVLDHAKEEQARGAAFLCLVTANLALAAADAMSGDGRLFAPHRWPLGLIVVGAALAMTLILGVPTIGAVFQVEPPGVTLNAGALLLGVALGGWGAVARRFRSKSEAALRPELA